MIDRRKMILDAATQSFAQFGYKATTMELIAKIANVGKGTIYTFYNTKEELFGEILNNALKEMTYIIEQGIKEDDTFYNNLFRIMDLLMEFRSKHELFIKLGQEHRDIGTSQAVEGIWKLENLILDYLGKSIDKAIKDGEIRPCDSTIAAFVMFKIYVILTGEWSKTHKALSNEQIKEYIGRLLFQGLLSVN